MTQNSAKKIEKEINQAAQEGTHCSLIIDKDIEYTGTIISIEDKAKILKLNTLEKERAVIPIRSIKEVNTNVAII